MGRTDEQRGGVGGGRGRGVGGGVFSPSGCPLCVAMPCFVTTILSGINQKHYQYCANISRQCKQEYTLWQLVIVKIQLTICKHKKAVGNEKRAKTSKNRQKHSWKQDTWHGLQQYQQSDWHEGRSVHWRLAGRPVSTNRNGVKTTCEHQMKADCHWLTRQIYTEETVSLARCVWCAAAVLFTSERVRVSERPCTLLSYRGRVWAGSYLSGRWLCWRGSWWRCLPRWAGGWDCWGRPCRWWPPAPARPPSLVCRWTCRTPWSGCWTRCWRGWFPGSGAEHTRRFRCQDSVFLCNILEYAVLQ